MSESSQNASNPKRAPQRERGRQRVAALLEAADAVFAEKGYDAATMTEIAARAGSAIGSLYQFFPTKPQVAEALMDRYEAALTEQLATLHTAAATLDSEQLATTLLRALIDFRRQHPAFVALAEAGAAPQERASAIRAGLRRQLQEILRQHRPALSEEQAAVMAVVVLQMMKTAVVINAEPGLAEREAALRELETMLRQYIDAA